MSSPGQGEEGQTLMTAKCLLFLTSFLNKYQMGTKIGGGIKEMGWEWLPWHWTLLGIPRSAVTVTAPALPWCNARR